MDDHVVQSVYRMLNSQEFADWYEGDFMDHLESDDNCKTTSEIMEDLKKMLH